MVGWIVRVSGLVSLIILGITVGVLLSDPWLVAIGVSLSLLTFVAWPELWRRQRTKPAPPEEDTE